MSEQVVCRKEAWGVAVEFSRPPVNVLTMRLLEELRRTFEEIARSPARSVLLRGGGSKCFSAGADVAEHLPGTVEQMLPLFSRTVEAIQALEVPTLAWVHGHALGGGLELALACDFVVVAPDARLGLPEITLGVFPPVAAAMLPLEIGSRRALELLLTGESIPAPRAVELGLANSIGQEAEAAAFLERVTRHPRPALAACKRAARRVFSERIASAERIYLTDLMTHAEPVEGLRAFLERRKPQWEIKS